MTNTETVNELEEFKKYQKASRAFVKNSKIRGDDFSSVLTGLYNNPSHFIYEILQNAEDAGAKEIGFELFEDRLDIYHNGKDFNLEDIKGVTRIGNSKKRYDLTVIGKFGVGFKSVFAITETPHIFSGKYNVKIEDLFVPLEISCNDQIDGTLIRLTFNHRVHSKKEVFTLIANRLLNIDLKTMLFLNNIENIKFRTPLSNGNYSKSSEDLPINVNTRKVIIKSQDAIEEYIVVDKPIFIEGKQLKVEIAYKLENDKKGKKSIVEESNSKLVVFFPTEKITFLNFIIQGPYRTTVTREDIPLENEQNMLIIEETGNLVSESLAVVKDLGYLDVNFLNILPIKGGNAAEQIYWVVYQKVKEKLLSSELLPTSDGKYAKTENSLLARGEELTKILDSEDTQNIFKKSNWLDTGITEDRKSDLRNYLIKELGIKEVDFEDFAENINREFMQTKTEEWVLDFYSRLLDRKDKDNLIDILKYKPIIKLNTDEYIEPFNRDGKPQVFLPVDTESRYKTVKDVFVKNKKSLKFLQELGIAKPDLYDEINEFILPKYQVGSSRYTTGNTYTEDFEKLLYVYENISTDRKEVLSDLTEKLSNSYFIYSVNRATGECCLRKPTEVYFENNDLKEYFEGFDSVYFVSDQLYVNFKRERLDTFLKELGVEDKPRRLKIHGNLSHEEIMKLQRGRAGIYGYFGTQDINYALEGLDNFLNCITTEKSLLLWKLLVENIKQEGNNFCKGDLHWSYYTTSYTEFYDAKFLETLKSEAWLVDKNGVFKKPYEITTSELSVDYTKENLDTGILTENLEFKPHEVDRYSEEDKKKWKIVKDKRWTLEEMEKYPAHSEGLGPKPQQENRVDGWIPGYKPNEIEVRIKKVDPDKIITSDLKGQTTQIEMAKSEKTEAIERNRIKSASDIETQGRVDTQEIGKWGEDCVFEALKKGYGENGTFSETNFGFKVIHNNEEFEVVCLNKPGNTGKGYDLAVKRNGIEIEYIEVKTKMEETDELIAITGTQWEFARKLFEDGEGDKYFLYVVYNAGQPNARIDKIANPVRLWNEGKLYAHPVNIRF